MRYLHADRESGFQPMIFSNRALHFPAEKQAIVDHERDLELEHVSEIHFLGLGDHSKTRR
jgi:hypothetical protein